MTKFVVAITILLCTACAQSPPDEASDNNQQSVDLTEEQTSYINAVQLLQADLLRVHNAVQLGSDEWAPVDQVRANKLYTHIKASCQVERSGLDLKISGSADCFGKMEIRNIPADDSGVSQVIKNHYVTNEAWKTDLGFLSHNVSETTRRKKISGKRVQQIITQKHVSTFLDKTINRNVKTTQITNNETLATEGFTESVYSDKQNWTVTTSNRFTGNTVHDCKINSKTVACDELNSLSQ